MLCLSNPQAQGVRLKQFKGYIRTLKPNLQSVTLSSQLCDNASRVITATQEKYFLLCSFTGSIVLIDPLSISRIYNISKQAIDAISDKWQMITHNVDASVTYSIYVLPSNVTSLTEAIIQVHQLGYEIVSPIDLYSENSKSGFGSLERIAARRSPSIFLALGTNKKARFMTQLEASVMLDRTTTMRIDNYLRPAKEALATQDNLDSIKNKAQSFITAPDRTLLEQIQIQFSLLALDQHPEVKFQVLKLANLVTPDDGWQKHLGIITQASTLQDFRQKTADLFKTTGKEAKYIISHCSVYSQGTKVIFAIRQVLLASEDLSILNDWLEGKPNPDILSFSRIKIERDSYQELSAELEGNIKLYASLCGYISGSIANYMELGDVAYSEEGTVLSTDTSLSTRKTASQRNLDITPITKAEFDSLHKYTTSSGGINRVCRGQDALVLKPNDKSICDVTSTVNSKFELIENTDDLESMRATDTLQETAPNLWLETNYESIANIDAVMNRARVISPFLVFRGRSFNPRTSSRGSLLVSNHGSEMILGKEPRADDTYEMRILRDFDLNSNDITLPPYCSGTSSKTKGEILAEQVLCDGNSVLADTAYSSTSLSWQSTLMFAAKQDVDANGNYEYPHYMGMLLVIQLNLGTRAVWLHNIASWDQQFEVLLDREYDTRLEKYLFTIELPPARLPNGTSNKQNNAYRKILVYSASLVQHKPKSLIPANLFQANHITHYDFYGRVPLRYNPTQAGIYAVARYLRQKGISGASMWSWAYKDTHEKTEEGANIFKAPDKMKKALVQKINAPLHRMIENNLLHFVGYTDDNNMAVDYGFELISYANSVICELYIRKIIGRDDLIRSYWTDKHDAGKKYLYNIHDFDPDKIAQHPEDYSGIIIDQNCSLPIGNSEVLPDGFELSADISHIVIPKSALQNSPKDIAECILMLLGKLDDVSTMPLQTIGRYMDILIQTYLNELAVYQSANARVIAHYNTCPVVVTNGVMQLDLRNLGNTEISDRVNIEAITLRYQITKLDGCGESNIVRINIARSPKRSEIFALCFLENRMDSKIINSVKQGTMQEINKAVRDIVKFLRETSCLDAFSTTYAAICSLMTHYQGYRAALNRAVQEGVLCVSYYVQAYYPTTRAPIYATWLQWTIQTVNDVGRAERLRVTCALTTTLFTVPVDISSGSFKWNNKCYSSEGEELECIQDNFRTIYNTPVKQELELNLTKAILDKGYKGIKHSLQEAIAKQMPLLLTTRRIVEKQMGIGVNEDILKTVDIKGD